MPDIVDAATRSRMMASIRGRDTLPEMRVRRALHRAGFRFRLPARALPSRSDLVLQTQAGIASQTQLLARLLAENTALAETVRLLAV